MIFQTPILALLLVSALASLVALWSGAFGLRLLRRWDIASGSAGQLRLERQTQLVSTLFGAVMLAELVALLLFVFNADRMAALFVGAMCAVGTLNGNGFGFPALYLKIAVFFAAALWLILDRADRAAPDFPLTRVKFGMLVVMVPLVLGAAAFELAYFLNLRTDVITSCCSRLFTPSRADLAADLGSLPPGTALGALAAAGAAVALTGGLSLWRARLAPLFGLAGAVMFVVAIAAIISVISSYVYEHPTHHCPFCLLKPEYGFFGYALYLPLFGATALSMGAGTLAGFAHRGSLRGPLPPMIRRLVWVAMAGFALFGAATVWTIVTSQLILF